MATGAPLEDGRCVGIRHRRKATREGAARPTTVAIRLHGNVKSYDLESETHELDFLMHRLPVEWRDLEKGEEVVWFDKDTAPDGIRPHHCKWRKVKKDEDVSKLNPAYLITLATRDKKYLTKVPCKFEGLESGDVVGMVLGGSGDRFAAALSRRGETIGATVWRIPPFSLADLRGSASKDDDHVTLARLVEERRDAFYLLRRRDREGIRVKEALDIRMQAMKARIGCEQRMMQALVGQIFLTEEGGFPEGVVQDEYDRISANDRIFQGLVAEEELRDDELAKAVRSVEIWKHVFEPITGCGPRLTAGLIAPIVDIRRFWVEPDPQAMAALYERSITLEEQGGFEQDKKHVASRLKPGMTAYQQLQIVRSWQAKNGKPDKAQLLTEAILCHEQRHALRVKAQRRGISKLVKFCGVHCMDDGRFPRRREGQVAKCSPSARQALYLLGDQFNRRPTSEWGKKLLECKEQYRVKHPHPIVVSKTLKDLFRIIDRFLISYGVRIEPKGFEINTLDGLYAFLEAGMTDIRSASKDVEQDEYGAIVDQIEKLGTPTTANVSIYTPGHLHKMAIWRTLTHFVRNLFREWTRIEKKHNGGIQAASGSAAA